MKLVQSKIGNQKVTDMEKSYWCKNNRQPRVPFCEKLWSGQCWVLSLGGFKLSRSPLCLCRTSQEDWEGPKCPELGSARGLLLSSESPSCCVLALSALEFFQTKTEKEQGPFYKGVLSAHLCFPVSVYPSVFSSSSVDFQFQYRQWLESSIVKSKCSKTMTR